MLLRVLGRMPLAEFTSGLTMVSGEMLGELAVALLATALALPPQPESSPVLRKHLQVLTPLATSQHLTAVQLALSCFCLWQQLHLHLDPAEEVLQVYSILKAMKVKMTLSRHEHALALLCELLLKVALCS